MTREPPPLHGALTGVKPVRPIRLPTEPGSETRRGSPVHPLAAMLLLVVDNLWNLADWAVVSWLVTVPLGFLSVFLPALVIQRFVKKDRLRRALALATVLGLVAAVPTSITGTPVGVALLAWFGLDKLIGRTSGRSGPMVSIAKES